MLSTKIDLESLKKFEKVTLRIDNISVLELSLIDGELGIDIKDECIKNTKLQRCEKEKFNKIMKQCDELEKKDVVETCKKYVDKTPNEEEIVEVSDDTIKLAKKMFKCHYENNIIKPIEKWLEKENINEDIITKILKTIEKKRQKG